MSTARIPDGTPQGLEVMPNEPTDDGGAGLDMNRRETADAAPHPPIRSGLASNGIESTCANVDMSTIPRDGRSDPPVKPTSEVAHQPGQQPAAWRTEFHRGDGDCELSRPEIKGWAAYTPGPHLHGYPCDHGSAVECSAERSRAHQRQGVAPAEGRAWKTPAMRTVELG